ncbi:terminase large subunit domain-containing protein [Tropicimonas sp. S265A]|uniref:terminase large subunit domain-containing protein n=1 Tax=Tropicimonas sp. S265A TaxID=3415134 RepID=UPI003C7AA997
MDGAPITKEEWQEHRDEARQTLPDELKKAESLPAVLLSYQAKLLATTALHPLVICEKSRRIGMTWAVAADAVLSAGASRSAKGMDVLYIGYNLDMAREFIDTCAMWAKAFMPAASGVEEFLFKDQDEEGADKDITAFRIRFASGFEIVALTSKPRSLRGRQGYVIFDEAAFHDALEELLKAAVALLMWGGKVLVISTHDGADNPFNEFINEIRSKRRDGEVLKVTFDDAIADGLYERIAMVRGLEQTPEARLEFVQQILGYYADDANEELHCIPKAGTGAFLSGALIEACMSKEHSVARLECPDGFQLRPKHERTAYVDKWLDENVGPALLRMDPDLRSALGEDFARTTDLSVLAIGQEAKNLDLIVRLIIEMKNTPIREQKRVIRYVIERMPRFNGAKFDATGNGLGLAEWAQEKFGYHLIEAVTINVAWYLAMMPPLKGRFEDQTISLVADADVKSDLRALRLVRGVPTLPDTREKGRHGDAAIALAMLDAAIAAEPMEYAYEGGSNVGQSPLFSGKADDDDDKWKSPAELGTW